MPRTRKAHLGHPRMEPRARHEKGGEIHSTLSILEDMYSEKSGPRFDTGDIFENENPEEFLRTLVEFAEKKEAVTDRHFTDDPRLLATCGEIRESFFQSTGSVDEYIPLFDRLRLVARATRIRAIRKTFGGHLNSGLTYSLAFTEDSTFTHLEDTLEELSVSEQIDILHQLETVAADASANGQWSRPALERIHQVYIDLANDKELPLLTSIAANTILARINNEYENPQLGVVRYSGQENDSRLSTLLNSEKAQTYKEQSERLGRQMRTNLPPGRAAWFAPLGSDTLVAFDATLMPIAFAR